MLRINATTLAKLLGVVPETVSRWQNKGLIAVAGRTPADKRQKFFDLEQVRRAIVDHNLGVARDAIDRIDALLKQPLA